MLRQRPRCLRLGFLLLPSGNDGAFAAVAAVAATAVVAAAVVADAVAVTIAAAATAALLLISDTGRVWPVG